jgi:hypothetical protein
VHIRGLARTWLGREIANALTDCNVDKFCLIRYDGNKVSGHNCEFVAVESNMRPVVDPGVKVVSAYLPPEDDVMEPLRSMLSAVGGPFACSDAALTVKMDEWNQSVIG